MPWISSFRSKPSVTPWTMFATSARVSPCSARAARCSAPRPTTTRPSATFTEQRSWTRSSRRPLGPLTSTCCPWTPTCTPLGIAIGFLPILDIVPSLAGDAAPRAALPDVAEDLPAHLGFAGLPVREHAPRRGQDRHAHAAEHARNPVRAHVPAPPRLRDPPEPADHPLLDRAVLQVDAEHPLMLVRDEAEILDEPLLLEDFREPHPQLRRGDVHLLVLGQVAVADASQHVRYRIRHHRHGSLSLGAAYQEALATPGISPFRAKFRKQIRHSWNLRRYPRGRPHSRHRV